MFFYEPKYGYRIHHLFCPVSEKLVILLERGERQPLPEWEGFRKTISQELLHPKFIKGSFEGIPERYNKGYQEAIAILNTSPKVCAALCRRMLQDLLRFQYQIKRRTLEEEIHAFIGMQNIPAEIAIAIDIIRQIGNIAAHPGKIWSFNF